MSCRPNQKVLCGNIVCLICFNRSFATHQKSEYWSSKNIADPWQIRVGTDVKYYHNCPDCKHELFISPNAIKNGNFCKYCSPAPILCNNLQCIICFNKSFASHPKSRLWDYNKNIKTPRDYTLKCEFSAFFICECGHVFEMLICNIIKSKGCHYCCEPGKKLCDDEKCVLCFRKSFASHPRSKNWSPKNLLKPRNLFLNCHDNYLFDCECGHEILKKLDNVNGGTWCAFCYNKTEAKLYDWLVSKYKVIREVIFEWCKNPQTKKQFRFDFLLKDYNIIIELDGFGHFKQIWNWNSPDISRTRDVYKMKLALDRGYKIIRILQDDIWFDKIDWQKLLEENINKLIESKNLEICYINDTEIYDRHKSDMNDILSGKVNLDEYINSANINNDDIDNLNINNIEIINITNTTNNDTNTTNNDTNITNNDTNKTNIIPKIKLNILSKN